jgi:hypothetical protein
LVAVQPSLLTVGSTPAVLPAMYDASSVVSDELNGAVYERYVRHPSLSSGVLLFLLYKVCVVLAHFVYGEENAEAICHPSVASAVVLLALYWACVTEVQLALVEGSRVRQPSLASVVVFAASYADEVVVCQLLNGDVKMLAVRHPSLESDVVLLRLNAAAVIGVHDVAAPLVPDR